MKQENELIPDRQAELISQNIGIGETEMETQLEHNKESYLPGKPLIHENGYTVDHYEHTYDAGLAVMWNESDDQWPETFTRGVPFNAERIAEWMDRVEPLRRYVACNANGAVVGYGDLWVEKERPVSCYVALLNVHPQHQGHSIARKMLMDMVAFATEQGYERITIGTWPANLKAMPLYKKVGFFWIPTTNVYMENYLPTALRMPVAAPFFSKADWYRSYVRELKQVEDVMTHPETGQNSVYVLRWENGEDHLEVVINRFAQYPTGVQTPDLAAYAWVEESEPAQGLPYTMHWTLRNTSDQPAQVTLSARGEAGIEVNIEETITLAPGEERKLNAPFTCTMDAPAYNQDSLDQPAPAIRTTLHWNGTPVEFSTGLRHQPALSFHTGQAYDEGCPAALLPGAWSEVLVQVHNQVKEPMRGTLILETGAGVAVEPAQQPFQVGAGEATSVSVRVKAAQPGGYVLGARATFEHQGSAITTNLNELPVIVHAPGAVEAVQTSEVILVENDFFRLAFKPLGGKMTFWSKLEDRKALTFAEELGPPYVPWDLETRTYKLNVEQAGNQVQVQMQVDSGRFPGVLVKRTITITPSPVVTVHHELVNDGAMAHHCQLRPMVSTAQNETHDVTIPLPGKIVTENTGEYLIAHGDTPEKAAEMPEQWLAFHSQAGVYGVIWPAEIVKLLVEWGSLYPHYPEGDLAPQEEQTFSPIYLYAGPGTWQTIRHLWRTLAGQAGTPITNPTQDPLAESGFLDISLEPATLATLGGHIEANIHLRSTRSLAVNGRLEIHPPETWAVDVEQIEVNMLKQENPTETTLHFRSTLADQAKVQPAFVNRAATGKLRLQTTIKTIEKPFTVLRLGDEEAPRVRVSQAAAGDYETWVVDNSHTRWTAAPAYHAGITRWEAASQADVNHLFSPFPEEGELSWVKPFFGGIRPMLYAPSLNRGWPGRLHKERFHAAPYRCIDPQGFAWEGVQFTALVQHEKLRGIRVELAYLSLPGSNILKVIYRLVNRTEIYHTVRPMISSFCQVDGDREHGILHSGRTRRERTSQVAWARDEVWAAVENPTTGRAFVMVRPSTDPVLWTMDWGSHGGFLHTERDITLKPGASDNLTAYFVLAENMEEARAYRGLAYLSEPCEAIPE